MRGNSHVRFWRPAASARMAAECNHFLGPKQRCWAHLARDLKTLLHEEGALPETLAWVQGIRAVYDQARAARPPAEDGSTPEAARARAERARHGEALIALLCPTELDPSLRHATLAKRLRTHLPELFTFVRDPAVPDTNNAAERSLRPLVIARKISGGTRSATGSRTCMVLYSICATARLQGQDPTTVCQQILLDPSDSPSTLASAPVTL